MSSAKSIPPALVEQGEWFMRICNACRYCEGYCAVFPALERRLTFGEGDLNYLANLCHNCGSCYDACQYAPPHEFVLNFPRLLAEIRGETYKKYAWPDVLAGLFGRNGLAMSFIAAASLALVLLAAAVIATPAGLFAPHSLAEGSFYAVVPHMPMVVLFSAVALFVLLAFAVGFVRFWWDTGERLTALAAPRVLVRAALDVLTLKNLDGGGEGCLYPGQAPTLARRRFHHVTFYGFLLCFASTTVAAVYHYLIDWPAPYAFWSVPVLLGTAGGLALLIGPAGLLWLKQGRDPLLSDEKQSGMDIAFLVLLVLISLSGLLLLLCREAAPMGILLSVHLGAILALFITLPYGKFAHAVYRSAALVRFEVEEARPLPKYGAD
ncbi:MAG TPA: tricarballylate utilization 4Fe-4S protein TcuB [Candidatus Sulfotelmatobacter sp.]|nr:tricarballylate utilization 4Fe-4S protein TcuB [Candidatus Sulfotelmatobacter sp.]